MTQSEFHATPAAIYHQNNSISWHDLLNLLKLIQNDCQGAKYQIEQITQHLAERESLVNHYIQHAFISSRGFQTLCLYDYKLGLQHNQMGNAVLGGTTRPTMIPIMPHIEVRCLGRFEIGTEYRQIDHWDSVKAKSVLQHLLIKPREPTSKDALMEALWPDHTSQAANNNLKAAMHSLRTTLSSLFTNDNSSNFVIFSQGSYKLNPEINLCLDVEEFEKCWVNGRRFEKENKIFDAIREYDKAEMLYRGDYLEDEPYEEWTLLRREALKDKYLFIISRLAECYLITGDYESSIHYSQKVLSKDCCREDAYRRLMRCYIELGQRNRALQWYEICCQTIKNEMDTLPEDETTSLFQKYEKN